MHLGISYDDKAAAQAKDWVTDAQRRTISILQQENVPYEKGRRIILSH